MCWHLLAWSQLTKRWNYEMADHTEWQKGDYTISTDPDRLDREVILDYLATSYWAHWVDREKVALSLEHCMPFGLYDGTGAQVGFAKVVTDYARFAWLGDVFILEANRGHGLGVWLNETIKGHAPLVGRPPFGAKARLLPFSNTVSRGA